MKSQIEFVHHNYSTRSSDLCCKIPRVYSSGSSSFYYTGISQWNAIPLSVKQCVTKSCFKSEVKKYLHYRLRPQDQNMYAMY